MPPMGGIFTAKNIVTFNKCKCFMHRSLWSCIKKISKAGSCFDIRFQTEWLGINYQLFHHQKILQKYNTIHRPKKQHGTPQKFWKQEKTTASCDGLFLIIESYLLPAYRIGIFIITCGCCVDVATLWTNCEHFNILYTFFITENSLSSTSTSVCVGFCT